MTTGLLPSFSLRTDDSTTSAAEVVVLVEVDVLGAVVVDGAVAVAELVRAGGGLGGVRRGIVMGDA